MYSFALIFCTVVAVLVGISNASVVANMHDVDLPDYCNDLPPSGCNPMMPPMCDFTNNQQYDNVCLLCDAIKTGQLPFHEEHQKGPCPEPPQRVEKVCDHQTDPSTLCPPGLPVDYQCASNGVTFYNLCDLCEAVQKHDLDTDATFIPGKCR